MRDRESMLKILDLNIDAYAKGSLGLPEDWRLELLRLAHIGAKAESQRALDEASAAITAVREGRTKREPPPGPPAPPEPPRHKPVG